MTTTNTAADMSPNASPDGDSGKSGTRRVNNLPLYILGAAIAVFVLIMVMVASDRSAKQNQQTGAVYKSVEGNSDAFANAVAGGRRGGLVAASTPAIPAVATTVATTQEPPSVGAIQVAHPGLDSPPMPIDAPSDGLQDPARQQMQQGKLNQLAEAIHAKTKVEAQGFRSPGSSPGGVSMSAMDAGDVNSKLAAVTQAIADERATDPTGAYKAQLALLHSSSATAGADAVAPALASVGSGAKQDNDLGRFSGVAGQDRWALNQTPTAPTTRFELRAGAVVPATLISGINSELPGQIMAQISQNVYDTATGKYLLLPQGSRLVGTYAANINYGQSRILIAWQRVIFPDGKALDIGAMPGADGAGYGGFSDQVNNHYVRIFGSALLMSGITAGATLSQGQPSQTAQGVQQQTTAGALSQALGQQLGTATAQLIEKNLNIAPTLEIRPGYRFNVIVTKDIALTKPYKSFDY